jgi:hypothetical protein
MRPIVQTLVNGQNLQIPLDTYQNPFDVSVDVVVTGTVTYSVFTSNDNPWSGNAPINNSLLTPFTAAQATSGAAAITTVVRQVYVQVLSGTGSITVRVTQGGVMG